MTALLAEWRRLDDARHRAELYRLWHVATSAGFTTPQALHTMGVRHHPDVEATRRWLLDGTRRGAALSALAAQPEARLSGVEVALLTLGDEGGRLDDVLPLLADFQERKHRLMLAVRKRLTYPMFTALCASLIAPVPLLVGGHLRAYLVTTLVATATWMLLGGAALRTAAERVTRAPHLARARFVRALAITVEAGLPLPRAVRLAADASGDPRIAGCVRGLRDRRLVERPLSETLATCPGLSTEFLTMLANAERTGDYSGTLRRLADLYDDGFR